MQSTQPGLEAFAKRDEVPDAATEAAQNAAPKKIAKSGREGKTTSPCPHCGQHALVQTSRRSIDRFIGLFVNLRRYRCNNMECGWQGNLIKSRLFKRTMGGVSKDTTNWLMIAGNSVLFLIILLLLVALIIGWIDGSLEGAEGLFYRPTDTVE